jgi:tRNA N6-adenosine threonylcarbamoyltransferase
MRVLGIETSCDETAAAVVTHDGSVLSDVVHSQVKVHAPYGGVVPELASRDHMHNVRPVIEAALERAGTRLADVDGVAVTCRPGLSGALLVGVQAAQGLAWAAGKPIVGVDHLVGHLLAVFLKHPGAAPPEPPSFPFVALLASGGHTALYRVDGFELDCVRELGATRDDAAGEAFDKVAKLLGLGYPGGPIVDRLAHEGNPDAIQLAKPMARHDSLEFSFSGLKTSVARWVAEHGRPADDSTLRDLCAAFQRRVVDTLVGKAVRAARREGVREIVLAGGVAANRELRERAAAAAARFDLRVVVPPLRSCTDNAAMIAFSGALRLRRGENEAGRIEVSPRTALERVTRKGPGRRKAAP